MARLNWGATAERFYETGIDRGVLYTGNGIGVPWNGLTSVSESPTGGEAKPAYIDGYKFRNVASSEEYEATIEAFSAPKEFGPCDGSQSIHNGLIATQQPRQAFNFSYRTLVGNPIEGTDYGYKIHLVYNALAGPAQRSNGTVSDSIEASKLSWSVTTLPPSLAGMKPTAHFIIDTRETPRGLLAAIEDILYGTDVNSARMPLVSELVAMFQSEGPLLRQNLVLSPAFGRKSAGLEIRRNNITNPSFRAAGTTQELRRNYVADPRLITATGWTGVAAGGLVNAGVTQVYSPNITAAVGETWTVGIDITAPAANDLSGTVSAAGTTGSAFGANARGTTGFTIPKGTTQRVYNTFTLAAGADGICMLISITAGASAGAIIRYAQMEKAAFGWPYFDGTSLDAATGGSFSTLGNGTTITSNVTDSGFTWTKVFHPPSGNGARYTVPEANLVDGVAYTMTALVKNSGTTSVSLRPEWCNQPGSVYVIAAGDEVEVTVTAQLADYTSIYRFAGFEFPVGASSNEILIRDIHISPKGSMRPAEGLTYSWTGTANASASIIQGQRPSNGAISFAKFYQYSSDVARLGFAETKSAYWSVEGDTGGFRLGMVAGKTYTFSADARASADDPSEDAVYGRTALLYYRNAAGAYVQAATNRAPVGVKYGRVSVTVAIPVDAQAAFVRLFNGSTSGRTVDWKNMLLEEAGVALPYFDGATATEVDTGWTHAWLGTANASISVKRGWQAVSNMYVYGPAKGGVMVTPEGETRLRAIHPGVNISLWALQGSTDIPAIAGNRYKARMQIRQVSGTVDIQVSPRLGVYQAAFYKYASDTTAVATIPSDGSWVDCDLPSLDPVDSGLAAGTSVRLMLYAYGPQAPGGTIIEIRNTIVEATSEPGDTVEYYFDGNTPDQNGNFYSWAGAADASISRFNTWN